ncbi:EAL domain-containing protein [Vibrio sp. HN007]|uniref:EAL domain-containing protein n=1 Tax=Vibrio iocasae TaxID=3098914 RepID=UPI0035D3E98E
MEFTTSRWYTGGWSIQVSTRETHGFEALLRWKAPDGKYVSPDKFIPLLEESGDIVHVGKLVLKRSIELYKHLSIIGYYNYKVSINVSAIQLERPDFVEYICDQVIGSGLSPEHFPIELTETAIIRNEATIIEHLRLLQAEGFQIQLDDFGTGNASLNTIKNLPLNALKIDKSFTQKADENTPELSIIEAMVSMSDSLNFDVVIEGIETEEQHQLAIKYDIQLAQGYYYAKPMAYDRLIAWLKQTENNSTEKSQRIHLL